jgi:hypothetical protein
MWLCTCAHGYEQNGTVVERIATKDRRMATTSSTWRPGLPDGVFSNQISKFV